MKQPNPAAVFFASAPARAVAALLRGLEGLAPQAGTALALRLFLTPLPTKRRAASRPVPAGWSIETLPFEGSHLAVWRRAKAAPEAPRVLLVHGWGGDAQQLLPLAARLAADGFEPLLLDLPAHGRAGGWRSNLVQWTRALFAVTARHGPWTGVVGHSLGARALAHALARGLPAQSAALIAAAPPPRQFLGWFAAAVGLGDALAERMASHIEQREGVAMQRFEPDWLGSRLQQPTLLVHDRGDRTAPLAGSEALARALPTAELLVTEGLGHRRVLDDLAVQAAVAAALQPRLRAQAAKAVASKGRDSQ